MQASTKLLLWKLFIIVVALRPVLVWLPTAHRELSSVDDPNQSLSPLAPTSVTQEIEYLPDGSKLVRVNIAENLGVSAALGASLIHPLRASPDDFQDEDCYLRILQIMLLMIHLGLRQEVLDLFSLRKRFTMGSVPCFRWTP